MIDRLADALERTPVNACDRIRLYLYLSFARTYPQIGEIVRETLPETFLPDPMFRANSMKISYNITDIHGTVLS